jgi:hypothetical protein
MYPYADSIFCEQHLKAFEEQSLCLNQTRADSLRRQVQCQLDMSTSGTGGLRDDDQRMFDDMARPLSIQPGFSQDRLKMVRSIQDSAPDMTLRPVSARAKISAFRKYGSKTKVEVAAESTPSHTLKQTTARHFQAILTPTDHLAQERNESYLPVRRPETARTHKRTKELAVPAPRKQVPPRQQNMLWDKKTNHAASWCSPTLPQFGGTVYMCKLKWKLGYPVMFAFLHQYASIAAYAVRKSALPTDS